MGNNSVAVNNTDILARARAGDMEAFAGLVQQFQSAIVSYLFRLTGDMEQARDLAQDTFIQAYKSLPAAVCTISFRSWLYRIATNNALQYFRRQAKLAFIPLDESRPVEAAPGFVREGSEAAAVHEALLKLPERSRVCLVLHFVDGFKHREIAKMFGISEDAVRMRVERGCAEFRRIYRTSGGDLP